MANESYFREPTRRGALAHRLLGGLLAAIVAVAACGVAPHAWAQEADEDIGALVADAAVGELGESIVLNFEAADIREVIYSFASALDINYWVDPRVSGQVTLRTTGRIARSDLFPVFHQLLRNNGFTAIKNGDIYLIVPAEDGKTKLIVPKGTTGAMQKEDHFVMEVVKVKHVNADQMANTLAPFVSPGGDVIAYARSNLLLITDISSNARRLVKLVRTFDTDTFAEMNSKVYTIEHAILEDVAQEIQSILEAYQVTESGASTFIIPLLRLNALAVIAFDPTVFVQIEYWLEVLDVPAEAGTRRQVYVYQVENSKAVDLAVVLNQVYSEGGSGSSTASRGRSGAAAEQGLGLGGGLARRGQRGQQGQRGGQQETRRSATGLVLGGGDGAGGELFEQEVRIVEDEVTNSLVILATPRDYQTIRQVLRQLDIVPRQVLIEVLVAEISLDEDEVFSAGQSLLNTEGEAAMSDEQRGGTFFDVFGEEVRLIGALGSSGLSATISSFRDGLEVYQGVIGAVRSDSKSKILSRPHIMTADNQEARILVGDEVPIITSQSDSNVTTGGSSRFLQNIQYRDTGIIIRVLPQVNSEGLVNMELSLEVSEIDNERTIALQETLSLQSPTFTTREADTTVVVHSGETLIIGGIIRETQDEGSSGVPYLMDVPVLGRLFRNNSDSMRRVELIVLITPFVVRDRDEADSVTEEFKRRVDGLLREFTIRGETAEAHHTVILESMVE